MKITNRTLTKELKITTADGLQKYPAGMTFSGVLITDGLYVSNFHGVGKGECIPMRYFDESTDAVVML